MAASVMGPPNAQELSVYPPSQICEALYKINKQLRIGWAGRERRFEEELNPGSFAIIQLYHWSDVGTMDDLKTYREFWDRTLVPSDNGSVQFVPIWRGPLYDHHGGTSVDYDVFARVPIFVCTIDEDYHHMDGRPMCTDDVYNGSFLDTIKYWQVPIKRRICEKYREMGKRIADTIQGVGEEAGKFLYRESQRTGHTNLRTAKKFTKDAMDKVEEKHESSRERLENYYLERVDG